MARVTKTSITIGVMNENADKPMDTVVALIVAAQHAAGNTDVSEKIAAGAYRWCVRQGVATGVIPEKKKAAPKAKSTTKRTKKAAVAKVVKAAAASVPDAEPVAMTKSDAEIARIKEANLARIKEVAKKFNKEKAEEKRRAAEMEAEKEEEEAENARSEQLPSFEVPVFLTKEEVNILV